MIGDCGLLPLRRRRRDLAPDGRRRSENSKRPGRLQLRRLRRSAESRHRLHAQHGELQVARRRQHVHRLQGRAGRRRPAADVDRPDQRPAHAASATIRARSSRSTAAARGARGTTSRPTRSTTSRSTTRFRTGSTARSRTPAPSARASAATSARSRRSTGIRSSGWEWGTIVPDPLDPNTVYASGSGILKISYPSEQWINVSPAADASRQLRTTCDQPIVFAPWNQAHAHRRRSSRCGRRSTAACTGRRSVPISACAPTRRAAADGGRPRRRAARSSRCARRPSARARSGSARTTG